MKKRVTVKSSLYILLIVAFLLCAAIVKLLYIAISPKVDGIDLVAFAKNRNTKTKTLYASRGGIFDANGDALALSVNSYTLIAYLEPSRTTNINKPKHVVDKAYTSKMLATVLDIDEAKILEYLSKTNVYQVEFGPKAKNLTERTKKAIEDLELPGIDFIESTQRYYKMGNFASYIVGYAKTNDEGEIVGELGLESYYNTLLSGEDGYIKYEADAQGYQLPSIPSIKKEAQSGSDIYLTIDSNIQLIAENAISNITDGKNLDFAILTFMDAKTGAIVASATSPSFNPNDLNTITSYLNPLVSISYEPGSTMKIFSWADAIETGKYDGSKTYKSGSIDVADVTIKDWNEKGWGTITFDKGFAYSSNVAATNIALDLGRDELLSYYQKCGFGTKTGIELSGELSGKLEFKYKSELANAAFGQGIAVTPVQMLQALSSLTNNGTMVKPYIVSKIVDSMGNTTYEGKREEVDTIMNSDTVSKMQDLMYDANYAGNSNWWQPKSVTMLGKTGSAQISSPKGGYMTGKYDVIYSYAGIFPKDEPKYIVYIAVKRLNGTQKSIADALVKAVDEVSSYANLTESTSENVASVIKLDNYISKKTSEVKNDIKDLNPVVIGDGEYITDMYPKAGSSVFSSSKLFLITNSDNILMPDMTGWSLNEVNAFCYYAKIEFEYSGYGYVKQQSIGVNEVLKDKVLSVKLEY